MSITKTLLSAVATVLVLQGCSGNKSEEKTESSAPSKEYVMTTYQETYDSSTHKFSDEKKTDNIKAKNDTVAYLNALKKFYDQKVIERENFNFGQPKSFSIVDKDGVDLKVKLSAETVKGLTDQVTATPNVRKMLEEYQQDSLGVAP